MKVGELRPGMLLSQAVHDVNGRLLMGEGTCLSERFLGVLKAWGIAEVAVQGEKTCTLDEAGDGLPASLVARAQEICAVRLSRSDLDNPAVQDIFRLAVARVGHLLEKGEPLAPPSLGQPGDDGSDLPPLDLEQLAADDLPMDAVPEVLARLAQLMENPSASSAEAAEIIQCDPGLAAKLLKIVNSPLYGFPQRIDTISRAVTIIGVQQLSALALGVTVMGVFRNIPKDLLDIRQFWQHSLACACGARALASALGLPNTERYFVGGLLHDVGLLFFILHVPERVRLVLSQVRERGENLQAAERRCLGTDHAMAGGVLLSAWHLPMSLMQAAACHHDPLAASVPRDATIVHVADYLAEALYFGSNGQSVLAPLNTAALAMLGPPPGVAAQVAARIEEQLGQLESIFLGGS
ncbi:MAG: HDOD domain-containing protein [Acidobacteriota bacterium]